MPQNKAEETPPSLGRVMHSCASLQRLTHILWQTLLAIKVSRLCAIPGEAVLAMGRSWPGLHGLSPGRALGLPGKALEDAVSKIAV